MYVGQGRRVYRTGVSLSPTKRLKGEEERERREEESRAEKIGQYISITFH
jgi:hypothetical protein